MREKFWIPKRSCIENMEESDLYRINENLDTKNIINAFYY